jgi:hypothetical protein
MAKGTPSTDKVEREAYSRNQTYRGRRETEAIENEERSGQAWEMLKNTTLLLNSVEIKNPYNSRIYLPRPELNDWIKEFRTECKISNLIFHVAVVHVYFISFQEFALGL